MDSHSTLPAANQADQALGIEDAIEPGIDLFERSSLDALFRPLRQSAKATGEQAIQALSLTFGLTLDYTSSLTPSLTLDDTLGLSFR